MSCIWMYAQVYTLLNSLNGTFEFSYFVIYINFYLKQKNTKADIDIVDNMHVEVAKGKTHVCSSSVNTFRKMD